MAGAIDLGAVKARSDAAARAASAPPPAAGSFVFDVSEDAFQTDVLDRSFQVPVLLDLWAEWCQPCKQLSPILEKLALEAGGSWLLAKVDVDANPRISQALQVQSIPTVFAVIGGQLVPGFQGALPEAQVREFLTAVLQAAAQAGLTGVAPVDGEAEAPAVEEPGDSRVSAAEDALEAGDFAGAAAAYEAILASEPANVEADLALRQVRLLERSVGLDASAVTTADAAPNDVTAALAAADYELSGNDMEAAFRRLLALLRRTSGDDRDAVRDRLVEYFELIGPDDPRVGPARRDLTNALF
jgi:putative thioredoxin